MSGELAINFRFSPCEDDGVKSFHSNIKRSIESENGWKFVTHWRGNLAANDADMPGRNLKPVAGRRMRRSQAIETSKKLGIVVQASTRSDSAMTRETRTKLNKLVAEIWWCRESTLNANRRGARREIEGKANETKANSQHNDIQFDFNLFSSAYMFLHPYNPIYRGSESLTF